ncbi:hypothetical protein [Paenibacillus typhae]|uniref:Uncharacterized protein n=1 Tax=Paenibacillus typhae TaxID=1174501 RepID=A0A1G8P4N9_9BACL|nr:hypothetical protein [Paenibacillus typhae]SDI87392.1 hypothetical protein SAMN05216192_10987 [Paenibacillus typhae]
MVWEKQGYVRIPKAVPLFYVLRYVDWRQSVTRVPAELLSHHQSVWDIRSMSAVYAAAAEILDTPAVWAVINEPECAVIKGFLAVNRNGSSLTAVEEGGQYFTLEAQMADLIMTDPQRMSITGFSGCDWLTLDYSPAQPNNAELLGQRQKEFCNDQIAPVNLTLLGQKMMGLAGW